MSTSDRPVVSVRFEPDEYERLNEEIERQRAETGYEISRSAVVRRLVFAALDRRQGEGDDSE
jgi:hypothetical protein